MHPLMQKNIYGLPRLGEKKTSILPPKKWGILLKDGFSYEFPYISPGWKKWVPSIPRFWAEGKLLTPCLAFRNEGPYKARGQKYRCCAYGYIIWNPYIFTVTRCFFHFFWDHLKVHGFYGCSSWTCHTVSCCFSTNLKSLQIWVQLFEA